MLTEKKVVRIVGRAAMAALCQRHLEAPSPKEDTKLK